METGMRGRLARSLNPTLPAASDFGGSDAEAQRAWKPCAGSSPALDRTYAEQDPPPRTQNLAQWRWFSLTAPRSKWPPSAVAACASVSPISKRAS